PGRGAAGGSHDRAERLPPLPLHRPGIDLGIDRHVPDPGRHVRRRGTSQLIRGLLVGDFDPDGAVQRPHQLGRLHAADRRGLFYRHQPALDPTHDRVAQQAEDGVQLHQLIHQVWVPADDLTHLPGGQDRLRCRLTHAPTLSLFPAQLTTPGRRDHLRAPGRIPDEIDYDVLYDRSVGPHRLLDRRRDAVVQRAPWRGQRHGHAHLAPVDLHPVHEAKVDHVDAQLWVVDLIERRKNRLRVEQERCHRRFTHWVAPLPVPCHAGPTARLRPTMPEPKRHVFALAQTEAEQNLPAAGSTLARWFLRRVGDVGAVDDGEGSHAVWLGGARTHDVRDGDAAHGERVGDERAVAAPGDRLGAHDGDLFTAGEVDQFVERRGKLRRLHVVGKAAE